MFLLATANMYGKCDPSLLVFHLTENAPDIYSPGRFFAANELKAMMAYIVMNYDIELEDKSGRPPNMYIGTATVPNPKAKVKFRARQK